MIGGDLEGIGDGGRVDSERRRVDSLEELLLQGNEGGGAVGEDELRDWEEAVLEWFSTHVDLDQISRRRCWWRVGGCRHLERGRGVEM